MALLARLFRLIAASVVPGGGFLLAGWSPTTALALYWVDTLIGSLAMGARIALHRHWTGMAGHRRAHIGTTVTTSSGRGKPTEKKFSSFLSEYMVTTLVFTLTHGLFLVVLLGLMLEMQPDWRAVEQGALGIAACHVLALSFDSATLRDWPFARLKDTATRSLGRLGVMHATIIVGFMAMTLTDSSSTFFALFVWLKFLTDIGAMMPRWESKEPPAWLAAVASRFPKRNGKTFEEYWRAERAKEQAAAARDEQV